MNENFVSLRIYFSKEVEEVDGEEWVSYCPSKVMMDGTTILQEELESIAEMAGQSDFYQIQVVNALLTALDGETVVEW